MIFPECKNAASPAGRVPESGRAGKARGSRDLTAGHVMYTVYTWKPGSEY
jgi:hypothetical protein